MRLTPLRTFAIDSDLPQGEAIRRVEAAIGPTRVAHFPWDKDKRPFEGEMEGNRFRVRRVKLPSRSHPPVVRGTIEAMGQGSRITGTMEPMGIVKVLGIFWLSCVLIGGLFYAALVLRSGESNLLLFLPLAVLAIGLGLSILVFQLEARRALALLARLIDATHTDLQ